VRKTDLKINHFSYLYKIPGMFCKHDGVFMRINREEDESYDDYHMRCMFVMKNEGKLDYDSLVGYSHVYKNMNVLGCVYAENVSTVVHALARNLYVTQIDR